MNIHRTEFEIVSLGWPNANDNCRAVSLYRGFREADRRFGDFGAYARQVLGVGCGDGTRKGCGRRRMAAAKPMLYRYRFYFQDPDLS